MLAADGDLHRLLGTHADLLEIGESSARHDEFETFHIARLHRLAAERHAVAVYGDMVIMLSSTSMSAPVYTGRDSFVEMAKLVSAIMRAIVSCGRERLLQ